MRSRAQVRAVDDDLDLDVALAASSSRSPALASGGLAVVRPLAARASAFSGGPRA